MEDDFTYVVRKALRGWSLAPGEAAARAGLPETDVMAIIRGTFSENVARSLAPVLELGAEALARLPHYRPAAIDLPFIQRIDLPFGGERVNAWLVRHERVNLLFDTGFSDKDLSAALDSTTLDAVFITHQDRDHVGGIREAMRRCATVRAPAVEPIPGVIPMDAGEVLGIGALTIRTFDLTGHYPGALGYAIDGLPRPVCVVGDGLFAGSIGGCPPERYQQALQNLRRGVFTLPDETILLPGHGPATTVAEERRSNPFFART